MFEFTVIDLLNSMFIPAKILIQDYPGLAVVIGLVVVLDIVSRRFGK